MNPLENPSDKPVVCSQSTLLASFESAVRRHPCTSLLLGTGLGVAVVLAARAMATPPRHPVERVLEDIRSRLTDIAQPAYARATVLADDGANAFHRTVDSLHLDSGIEKLSRGFKRLFH